MATVKKAKKAVVKKAAPKTSVSVSPQETQAETYKPNRIKLFVGVPAIGLEQEINKWIATHEYDVVDIQFTSLGITNLHPEGKAVVAVTFRYDA